MKTKSIQSNLRPQFVKVATWFLRVCLRSKVDKFLAVPGWTSRRKLQYLRKNVRSLDGHGIIVEIGVWFGRSALAMADACRGTNKRVFAIDPWMDFYQDGVLASPTIDEKRWGVKSFEAIYEKFMENRTRFGLEQYLIPRRAESTVAAQNWFAEGGGEISMIFIDGNHEYDMVKGDLTSWFPFVKEGGLICGDDWDWPAVQEAVYDFLQTQPQLELEAPVARTMWAFRK